MLILAERDNTFWRLRPLRPPWGHLGSPCLPDVSQIPLRCLQMLPRCFQMLPRYLPDASRCFPDASRCVPDTSQMLPRCLPDTSQLSSRCLPDVFQRCIQMLPDASKCIQMPPPWCLPNDASPMMLAAWCLLYVFLKNICLGSYAWVICFCDKESNHFASY